MKKKVPPRPGLVLKKLYLEPLDISHETLAKKSGIPQKTVSDLVNNRTEITIDLSKKLTKFFETEPDFWINLQTNYDLWQSKEGNRGTDDPFYTLMRMSGDAIFKLIGVDSPENYTAKAVVLKEKKLYPDIMAVPKTCWLFIR